MATKIDQKAYLQKYLGGQSGDKKKKKKKVSKGKGFKIIDDDIDLSKLRPLDGDELDILGEGEDAPQIAGIIDERPEDVRKMEQFNTTSKWRVINEDDGFSSKLQIQEIKKDIKEVEKENELIFGKMYSDSEDEQKNNSDLSPPRKQSRPKSKNPHKSDDDLSPPRRKKERKEGKTISNDDSDLSPPRKHEKAKSSKKEEQDLSPPRRNEKDTARIKSRKASRWGDFKEEENRYNKSLKHSQELYQRSSKSPKRKRHKNRGDSDNSPQRKPQRDTSNYDSDLSPPRKSQKNYDSDLSPPRKSKKNHCNRSPDSDQSPPRKRKNSPERYKDRYNDKNSKYNKFNESGRYSERRENHNDRNGPFKDSRRSSNEQDRRFDSSNHSLQRNDGSINNKRKYNRNSDSPPPTNKKMEKTLEGKKAGLQDAVQLRQENEAFRMREDEAFKRMTDDISGKNAQVVSRKGKRETSEERRKHKEKADKQKELDDKYKKWSRGLKQMQDQEQRVQEFMHEASKPLARHKGDKDLEERLKDIERDGDPMLKYIRAKKRERGDLGPEKPTYRGSFPPNRFNIRPGYRWDGVDRSNGYERKFFEQQNKRKAQAEEAYKWSTEDL